MSAYGFSVHDKSSEIHFSKYNNNLLLKSDDYVLFGNVDFNINTMSPESSRNVLRYTIPSHVVRYYKENNLIFSFIPVSLTDSVTGLVCHRHFLNQFNSWSGGNITVCVVATPLNLTAYYQYIQRDNNNKRFVQMGLLVGFQ